MALLGFGAIYVIWYFFIKTEDCGNVVTLPDGTKAICPPGWNNKYLDNYQGVAVGCDKDKNQCMACLGSVYPKGAPGPLYPKMTEWPAGTWNTTGLVAGPMLAPNRMAFGSVDAATKYATNPMPIPVGAPRCATNGNGGESFRSWY